MQKGLRSCSTHKTGQFELGSSSDNSKKILLGRFWRWIADSSANDSFLLSSVSYKHWFLEPDIVWFGNELVLLYLLISPEKNCIDYKVSLIHTGIKGCTNKSSLPAIRKGAYIFCGTLNIKISFKGSCTICAQSSEKFPPFSPRKTASRNMFSDTKFVQLDL